MVAGRESTKLATSNRRGMADEGTMLQNAGVRPRILVVDDDDAVREGIARALRSDPRRYEVETAGDGTEAHRKLEVFRPDLAILDVLMPGIGGLEICRAIRGRPHHDKMKIIILTGFPGGGNPEKSLFYDADLFLSKPQSVSDLRTHIEDLLGSGP